MSKELEVIPDGINSEYFDILKGTSMPKTEDIGVNLFLHRLRKSTQLIGNQNEQSYIKARREWMEFDFVDLIYITSITVYALGYEDYHELELSYIDFTGRNTVNLSSRYDDGAFTFKLNSFMGGFGLRPNERWFKDSKLASIEVRGVEQRYFGDVISLMRNLNSEIVDVEEHLNQYLTRARAADANYATLKSQLHEIQAEIGEKEGDLADINAEIQIQGRNLDEASKKLAINEAVKRNVDAQVQDAHQKLESLSAKSSALSQQNQEKEASLLGLQNDINLFPTEISGYIKQGAKNVKLYAWLCVVPLGIIVFVTWRLFSNSEKILDYMVFADRPVIEFLLSRFPYVVVSFAILAVCYTLLNRLISEVIGINRRRQDLFKINIIATDVSYASQHGLDVSAEEAYNLRTETKMELMKEHLRQHIGDEFVYNPKGNLFHKLSQLVSRQIDDEDTGGVEDNKQKA